jgi:hypothetical protein
MGTNTGNRQDNRQRGNAAQLLEKYKGMARDAQMQGDRVQSEYYLQFADHYYRILNENRARYEEQRRQQGYDEDEDQDQDQDQEQYQDDTPIAAQPRDRFISDEPARRQPDETREPRESREARESRHQGNGEYRGRRPRPARFDEEPAERDEERIAADSLPPAIAVAASDEPAEEPRAPRRRPRRPRDSGEEIAPAA